METCVWNRCPHSKGPEMEYSHIFRCGTFCFTLVHNQTVLCPVLPYGPSTRKLACCCRGLTRFECSGRGERAAAARGGPRNTVLFLALGARPSAAALLGPWGTQAWLVTRAHSQQPSSWCHSFWGMS